MALVPLKLPAGVVRNGTQYSVGGRWFDANLVRWSSGMLLPIGGWQRQTATTFTGVCRGLFSWRSLGIQRYLAVGTNSKLYAWNDSGTLYDITPAGLTAGRVDAVYGLGYGTGPFGASTFGTARAASGGAILDVATWSFDTWGEYLVAVAPHNGNLFEWTLNTASVATTVTNAPVSNLGVLVTPERHLVALGAGGNGRKVQWSSQEDRNQWTVTATTTAGDQELQTSGTIKAARRVRGQTLIVTDVDAHIMTYVGLPYIYGFERVGSFCGVVGANAIAAGDTFAVWMGVDNFYKYDGAAGILPCDVHDYVFGDINTNQISKVYAGANPQHSEIWWFYPSASSTENDRYVLWNYRENHWSIGQLARTAWTAGGIFRYPFAASTDGYVYSHEQGWTAANSPLLGARYAESGAIEIGNGDAVAVVTKLLPDEKTQGQVTMSFKTRFTPNGPESTFGPYSLDDYTDVRFTGRQAAVRVTGAADADWRVGTPRVEATTGGGR